ncbi:hypothetical protein [uncultured Fibrobacter sp.]|jgi:hypothetical protein|uniref:hypothetical protein n=1 Tax=uncultured Fibrobacter sp. TaxID=261512 RepID=UPI0025EE42E1|nr:hypothetical protein [uncultured Fibrobacter sp.]
MTKLDEILNELGATNHALVEKLPVNLNHKMVQKARLGKKPVPKHTQNLILQALNMLLREKAVAEDKDVKQYKREEVFGIEARD